MSNDATPAHQTLKQTSEEVLNDEAYHLYVTLIDKITQFQLGRGEGPSDDDVALWRAVQSRRIASSVGPLDTFFYRPDRRTET
jgi:hypothetical protein